METFCYNCFSSDLQQLLEDVTCMDCGVEQRIGPEVLVSYDMQDHMEPWQEPHAKKTDRYSRMFDILESKLNQPEAVTATAKRMLSKYEDLQGTLKCQEKMNYVAASLYYASRTLRSPLIRKRILDEFLFTEDVFSAACKQLKASLTPIPEWAALFNANTQDCQYSSIINPILSRLSISQSDMRVLRSKINNIANRLSSSTVIKDMHPTTIGAGMIYVASKSAKIPKMSMNFVSQTANITVATIINAEKIIIKVLVASQKL
jgi:transcription initiation factor TFIIIB Brf1 subunit/transcription initiation factor TFIIB